MVGAGALAEEDVQRPAHAGTEGIGGADQVERLGAVAQRQQQPDAEHRQADQRKSSRRREERIATSSGPVNSRATAMPSGTVRTER